MAAILNFGRPTSDKVDRVIPKYAGVEGVIVAQSLTVQKLFRLPVSVAAILNLVAGRRREISGNVDSVISKSGLVENVGVEVKIASLFQAV